MGSSKSKQHGKIYTQDELYAAIEMGISMKKLSKIASLYLIDSFKLKWDWSVIFNRSDLEPWFKNKYLNDLIASEGF